MTELHGTFDAAKADWSKLFGEAPKSIDDIDVIGLHDKTIGKKREFVAIARVLEIVDSEAWSYCDYIIKHENGNRDKQGAASHLADNIREAILALKGGECDEKCI